MFQPTQLVLSDDEERESDRADRDHRDQSCWPGL